MTSVLALNNYFALLLIDRSIQTGADSARRGSVLMAPSGETLPSSSATMTSEQPKKLSGLSTERTLQVPAEGPASILAMDIAVPPTYYLQDTYPDYLFNLCNLNHKEALKAKFKFLCKQASSLLNMISLSLSLSLSL